MDDSRLVAAQLTVPEMGLAALPRPRLVEQVALGASRQITIISGEPASGKTSLLVEWTTSAARAGTRSAWLTVPARLDDENRFWEYLLAAIETLDVPVGDLRAALLDGEPPGDAWLTSLANRLGQSEARRVIVIDDLHELAAPGALSSLCRLLEMRPHGLAFVLATRRLPPWPLSSWRMSGRLTEIRSGDLRISHEEARALIESSRIELSDDEIAQLVQRTEGWFGGVRLATLALERTPDPKEFLARFADGNELVATYLLRDVLARQEDEIREFLLDVSVLDVASAGLCDEIRGATDSAELLERCRTSNLFVSRVGDNGGSYRFHDLFRELLSSHLQLKDPERYAALHRRAGCARERVGDVEQAIKHAVAAGDGDRVTKLVIVHAPELAHQGRFDELRRLASIVRRSGAKGSWPNLLALASAMCFSGEANEALRLLDEIDHEELPERSRRLSDYLRAAAHLVRGEVDLLGDIGRHLQDDAPADPPGTSGAVTGYGMFIEGIGCAFEGDLDHAAELLRGADEPGNRPSPPAYIAVMSWAALVAVRRGDVAHAERCISEALERREELSSGDTAAVATAFLAAAEVEWERNRLDESAALYGRARRSVSPMPWQAVVVECSRSRLTASLGEPRQALEDLSEAGKLYLTGPGSPLLVAQVAERAVDVCLRAGDTEAALGWAHTHARTHSGELPWATRIHLARATGGAWCEELIADALAARQPLPGRIDTLLVAAVAAAATRDDGAARSRVAQALSLAEPGRMIRRFVDGGPQVAPLVADLAADQRLGGGPDFSPFFAAEVHEAIEAARGGRVLPVPVADELVDQLSVRELDVLGLLAKGLSYSEMGKELFVSRNTIKSHVQHVYTKLGVASRSHAVETGLRLGLIP